MKKATKVSLVAALAVSALTPAMAIGAETNHAAPGFYNVDNGKVVTADAFVLLSNTEKVNLLKNTNVYYADGEGKVVQATKIIDSKTDAALVAALFPETELEADKNVTLTPEGTVVPGETAELKVESVKAINATQVEVKFTQAVDKVKLFEDGVSGAFRTTAGVAPFPVVTLGSLDGVSSGALAGKLSADGKTLTVTSANPLSKRYDVVIDNVKSKDGKDIVKYEEMITVAADKTAPTILGTEKLTATTVKVKFSEPMKAFTGVTFKYADGTAITAPASVTGNVAAGAEDVTFTMNADVVTGKEIVATFIGAQDQAGNLLTPNPATVTFVKGAADGVVPTVGAITQTGATTFSIKFSEQIQAAPAVTVGGTATTVVKDQTDPTVYNYTLSTGVLDGAQTVAIATFTDLSGEVAAATSKVVTFVKDAEAPKLTSSAVVKDATNNKEYLELTFDKDIVLTAGSLVAAATTNGSYVKDFVTTPIANAELADGPITYKSATNKKVVRVELDTLLATKDVKDATYTLNLALTDVKSAAAVGIATAKVTFTRGEDGVAGNTTVLGAPTVTPGADNNKVNVSFPAAVDGASAIDVSNYKVDGAVVESVTLNPGAGPQVAVLNLKQDSNTFTGTRNISISGVKALGSSKTMVPFTVNTVTLKENVAPTVTKATLTGTTEITLTFSEKVEQADTTAVDFELLAGGKSLATPGKYDSALTTTAATTGSFTITALDAETIAKGLSLKALSTLDIVDEAGNKLSVPANITIAQ